MMRAARETLDGKLRALPLYPLHGRHVARRRVVCCVETERVNVAEDPPTHVSVEVQIGTPGRVYGQWIRGNPPSKIRAQVPHAEVLQTNLDVLLLPGEAGILAEPLPAI